MAPALGMARLLADLRKRHEFPAAAAVVSRLRRVVGQDTASATDVARVILQDPGLSSKVLRVVNSAFYAGRDKSTSTVTRSVFVLGFDAIRDLATGIALLDQIAKTAGGRPAVQVALTESLLAGLLARALAPRVRYGTPEEAYLLGLFANWGELWLAAFYPVEFARAERLAFRRRRPLDETLQGVFGVSTGDLATRILEGWNFPACYAEYFRARAARRRVREGSSAAALFGIVDVAAAYSVARVRGGGAEALARVREQFSALFKLDARELDLAAETAAGELDSHAALLGITPAPLDPVDTEEEAGTGETGEGERPPAGGAAAAPGGEPARRDGDPAVLAAVAEVTRAITERADLEDTLRLIVAAAARSVGCDFVLLVTGDDHPDARLAGRCGIGDGAAAYLAALDTAAAPAAGILLEAIRSRTQCVIERATGAALVDGGPALPGCDPASLIVQPLVGTQSLRGALVAGRSPDRPLATADGTLVRLFADQASLALDRCAAKR